MPNENIALSVYILAITSIAVMIAIAFSNLTMSLLIGLGGILLSILIYLKKDKSPIKTSKKTPTTETKKPERMSFTEKESASISGILKAGNYETYKSRKRFRKYETPEEKSRKRKILAINIIIYLTIFGIASGVMINQKGLYFDIDTSVHWDNTFINESGEQSGYSYGIIGPSEDQTATLIIGITNKKDYTQEIYLTIESINSKEIYFAEVDTTTTDQYYSNSIITTSTKSLGPKIGYKEWSIIFKDKDDLENQGIYNIKIIVHAKDSLKNYNFQEKIEVRPDNSN